MSCDSHSLGDIPGESSATITLQSILVPSTNIDDVDTDDLPWGLDSILPVHTTEEELRGLANVAVTDHAYAIPANREPQDHSSPLMTSRSVQTPFEHSDDDQSIQAGQEIACSDPDAAATIAALVAGVPEETFTTYSIYVPNNDTIHNVTEAMLSSLQLQKQEDEEDEDETPPLSESDTPKKEISPAVTPTNIREIKEKEFDEEEDSEKEMNSLGILKTSQTSQLLMPEGLAASTASSEAQINQTKEIAVAGTDSQGNIISFLQPLTTSTPMKPLEEEAGTPPSTGRGRGRGQRGRGKRGGGAGVEASPVRPGAAGQATSGKGAGKAATSRGRGATPTGRGRGRGRGGGSAGSGRKKKVKDETESEESVNIPKTDQSTSDVLASPEVLPDTLLAGRPKRRPIKNRKYVKDSDSETEKPKAKKPGRPPKKNAKKDDQSLPKGASEANIPKESESNTPVKMKGGRGGKKTTSKMMTSADDQLSKTDDISTTDVSMDTTNLSKNDQASIVSQTTEASLEEPTQTDISSIMQELDTSLAIPSLSLNKSERTDSNNLMEDTDFLINSINLSLNDSKIDTTSSEESVLSHLIKKPTTIAKKGAVNVRKAGRGARQGLASGGRGKKGKSKAPLSSEADSTPDVSFVGKKKKVKVKEVERKKKKKKNEMEQTDVAEKKKKKKIKKKKKKEEIEDKSEEEEEEEEDADQGDTSKAVPLMKTGRPKRQARIRKEEREKAAKASELEAKKKKKLKKKNRALMESDDDYIDTDDDDDSDEDSDDDDDIDDSDDDEEVPLLRLKKQQSSAKGKKMSLEHSKPPPPLPAKKNPKLGKKAAALQAKVDQVEKERLEEEKARQAADEKARAEQKARAEKEAKKLRKMRKSEESLDKTMTDLFKPDGVILHESSALTKKDSDSEIHIEHISQILSDKSGHSITSTNEVQTNKTVGLSEATNKAALTPTLSKASPKLVQARTDDQSAVSVAKTSTIHKGPTSSVPFPKSVASKSPASTNNTTSTTLITSSENVVAASTVSASPTSSKQIDKPVTNVTNSNNIGLSPIKEKVTSPVTTPKVASSKVDSQTPKKTPPFSLKERHSGEKRKEKLVANETEPVQMEAQTTMNEKLANDNATKVSVSIGCQADEDSEYEYASCTEEADDDSQLEAKSRGKACSICSMVQDNQYLVNCDICKKSFHGHCAELTLEDMQRILQDGEKFVCDNCPIDGASGAAVSTTDTLKEEDMPNTATINATTPVDVPAVHSTEQSSEKVSPTSTKQIKEKKQHSEEVVKSSPVKTAVKDLVSTSSTSGVAVKKAPPPPSDHKKKVLSAPNQESFPKKDSLALAIKSLPKIPKKSSSETKALPKSSKEKEANREKERRKEKERLKSSKEQKRKESSSEHQSSKESKNHKNSKERSDSSSHREKKASSSKDKKESLNRNKHRVSSKDKRESKDYTSTPPTTKTFGSMTARKHEVSSAHVSSSTGQTNETDKKSSSDGLKKKKLLHFKDVDLKKRTFQQCIGTGCKHDARPGSVYCSDDCIVRHAQESLALLKNERHWQQTGQKLTNKTVLQQISPSPAPPPPPPAPQQQQQQQQEKQQVQQQPQQSQEKQPLQQAQQQAQQSQQQVQQQKKDNSSKVVVLERKTGRILTGPTAPTESGLKEWLTEHPTFEVLQPSQSVHKSSSFYNKEKRQVNSERRHSSEQKKRDSDSKLSSHSVKGTDDVRHNVRKSLHEALTNRAQEAENVIKSNTELKQLVFSIEAELYKLYNDSGHKYKARYRSLIFNIKDTNNKGLFRKILSRSIKPHRLVRMTADELASSELAQWRQKEAKHTLELIEQREVEAIKDAAKAHVVKKTHKGEVDVIDEDLSTLEAKSVPVEKIRIHPKADIISGIVNDTTESHRTHLFDLNCKICTGKMAPPSDEPPSKKSKREAATPSAGQSEANKSSKSATSKSEKTQSTSKSEADLLKEEEVKNVIESIRAVTQQVEATANEIKASPGSPLPSAMKTSRNVTVRSPDSVLQSGLEKKVKFSPSSPLVWKGFIHMQDLVKFMTTAYRMSGPTEHLELQDTIHVCGRIAPELIWDYLTRIKQTGSRDICVLRFLPGSFDEKNAYVTLYSYLNSRGRCGVVGNNSRHIKDMYIVPLASHSKIPPLLLPFDEPGLEDNRPHMLLGVIVRQKVTKRPVEQLSSTSQANLASDNDAQTKRLKYDPNLPSTTIKVDSLSSQQPAKYDPMQPATLPPKYPVATQRGDDASSADTQPTSSAMLPELKEKYYNTPSATYTPSPVVNVKTDRFKQPSPSPVDSSTSDSPPDAIGSRINDPIVKAFGKMDAISEPVNTTPVEDLSAAPYSPTQYDPDPTSSRGPQTDNSVSTSNNINNNNNNNVSIANKDGTIDNNDYPMLDDEKPYDPEECDFEASADSPPPPPPPPPTISTTTTAASVPLKGTVMGITAASTSTSAPKPSAVSMDKIFDQIKMSTLSPGVSAIMSTVSSQSSKAEKKDLLTELTQRVGEKKMDAPLPKPSTAGLPTALQNLFSQVSKVSMTSNLTPNLGTGIPPIPSTTSTVLPMNLPSVTQASTLASIQLPQSSLVVTSSNKLSSSTFTVNTSTPPLTKSNAKDITKTTVSESSHLSQNLAIPGVKKEQALSSLMQRSNIPPISETGWSTIAQTLASLAKVQKTNLTSQIPSTKTTTSVSNAPSIITKSSGADGSNHSPSSVDFKNISESLKTTPNIPQKDVFASGPSDAKQTKTSTYSASKAPDGGKLSSVRIAFSTGPKHPLVPHAAFKEEEKPKMHSLFSETKIPGLGGLDEEEEEEKEVRSSSATTTTTAAPKDNAFLSRAEFDALSSIAKTDSFLAGGLRSDSFISNWKGINIGSKDGASQPLKDETKQGPFDPAKIATEQQQAAAAVVKVQQDNQVEIARSRSDTHSETMPSSSSTKTKPESSSNKDVGKQRYESTSSSKNRDSHHDSKSRLSHDASKESRRRSDSDRKRSSSGSGHHSDSGSSSSKNSRYSDRSDRHGHSRHSRSRDYSDKRDRDYRKDYGSSDHRSRDRDHERDRDYDHGSSSKSKDRGSDRKDHRRSSSSGKSDDRTGSKKTSDKSDKFGNSMSNEDSNKYGDVDERKKGYGASSSFLDSANRFTAEKKEMPSSLDGSSKTYKASVKKEADDTFKNLQLPNQDQDLRKSLAPNVVPPPGGVVPSGAQPIPTLMSSSLEEFPSDVDHRKHGLSWPALYEHKTKDAPENEPSASVGSLWTNRGDIDYRSQSNPSAVVPRNLPPPPPHNQGSAIPGWSNTVPPPPHMGPASLASFQSISTVLNQRPLAGKLPIEPNSQTDQDMRKPAIAPQKIEVILPRPTAKDFFGTTDSESSDSMSQSPSNFDPESARQRMPGTFIAPPSGNTNESQNNLRVVLQNWNNAMVQEKLGPNILAPSTTTASISTPQDVDDRRNIYRKVGLSPAVTVGQSNLLTAEANSSKVINPPPPVDAVHPQDPAMATPDVKYYSTGPPPAPPSTPHSSHLEHIVTSTTVVSSSPCASPQETRPVKSVAPTPPAAVTPLPVITQELPKSQILTQNPTTYGPSQLQPHSEFAPKSHIQSVVEAAATERLKPKAQWEGQQPTPQNIPDHNPHQQPLAPPQHDTQKNNSSIPTTTSSSSISSSSSSNPNSQSHTLVSNWPSQPNPSSSGQAPILSSNEFYETQPSSSSDPTTSSSPSSSAVTGLSPIDTPPQMGASSPLSSVRAPPPPMAGGVRLAPPTPPPVQSYPGSGPQHHPAGQFVGPHSQSGHGYHLSSRTDYHQAEQHGPRTFAGPRHPFRAPGVVNFPSGHGSRMEHGGNASHFPHQRQGSRFN